MDAHKLTQYLEFINDPYLNLVRKTRSYRIPKGYMRWETLSALVASSLHYYKSGDESTLSYIDSQRMTLWYVKDAPLYLISEDLLNAFENSDIEKDPDILEDLEPSLPTFLLMFPSGSIVTGEGNTLDYCIIHMSEKNAPQWSEGEYKDFQLKYLPHDGSRHLHWSGIDSGNTLWVSGNELEEQQTDNEDDELFAIKSLNRDFLKRMRSICLQTLLAMTYAPELLSVDEPEPELQLKGFGRKPPTRREQTPARYPRWLGKNYQPRKYGEPQGTHASPRGHWRKRHRRRQHFGPRVEGNREWIWIKRGWVG